MRHGTVIDPLTTLLGITSLLAGLGGAEAFVHRRRLAQIPTRVHVNGTRGKSSVTRLIAAGFRAGGRRTCAKTTGTLARMIFPDGEEFPVLRTGRANVIEQVRIVETAVAVGAESLVVECMALQPAYQWLSESKLVRATIGVITNAREDHLEVMGPTEEDVALALCGMVPIRGQLFTAEQRHLSIIEQACRDRRTQLHALPREQIDAVTDEEMSGFKYVEHRENVALALSVCRHVGIARRVALEGMWSAQPDPGVLTEHSLDFFGRRIVFFNGFAANDPESTERLWNLAIDRYPRLSRRLAVFNCRHDRPERSVQLAKSAARWKPADRYVLIGSGTYLFANHAVKAGIDPMRLVLADQRPVDELFEIIIDQCERSALVMGMGNIGGPGLDLVRYFRNRSAVRPAALYAETA
ncbi:poly-gamma-glutamate synthase PgsB [bacterium]|nr:poly-gamma-glutamate synthase PgsB [bacterium]